MSSKSEICVRLSLMLCAITVVGITGCFDSGGEFISVGPAPFPHEHASNLPESSSEGTVQRGNNPLVYHYSFSEEIESEAAGWELQLNPFSCNHEDLDEGSRMDFYPPVRNMLSRAGPPRRAGDYERIRRWGDSRQRRVIEHEEPRSDNYYLEGLGGAWIFFDGTGNVPSEETINELDSALVSNRMGLCRAYYGKSTVTDGLDFEQLPRSRWDEEFDTIVMSLSYLEYEDFPAFREAANRMLSDVFGGEPGRDFRVVTYYSYDPETGEDRIEHPVEDPNALLE